MFRQFTTTAVLFGLLAASTACSYAADKAAEPKKTSANVAVLTVSGSYPEGVEQPGLFSEISVNLHEMITRLEKAAKDDKVSAVLLEIRGPQIGRGKLNELRTAIGKVKKANKKVYAYLETVTGGDYLLAARPTKSRCRRPARSW